MPLRRPWNALPAASFFSYWPFTCDLSSRAERRYRSVGLCFLFRLLLKRVSCSLRINHDPWLDFTCLARRFQY